MTTQIDLRRHALEIFDVALQSVDAGAAVRDSVRFDGTRLTIVDEQFDIAGERRPVYALAIGKAAYPMAIAIRELLGEKIKEGFIVGSRSPESASSLDPGPNSTTWKMFEGAHPLPTKTSLAAARYAFEFLQRANEEHAVVIFLISGGGSSMIEWPRDGRITLEDLRMANRVLISCGANISEINAVRRNFSSVKGGGLSNTAPDADQITLVVSDTAKGEESSVASGPSFDPVAGGPTAVEVIERYGLYELLPASILQTIQKPSESEETNTARGLRRHYVILDNETALNAAANEACRRDFDVEFVTGISEQRVEDGVRLLLARMSGTLSRSNQPDEVVCLVSGGEFSCPVRGAGAGGRNAETVLRSVIEMAKAVNSGVKDFDRNRIVVLSAGTDGIDGNSPAAGAIADDETASRAASLGLDPLDFLERSDSYSFFHSLGDDIVTGPTGTNVRDLRIVLGCRR